MLFYWHYVLSLPKINTQKMEDKFQEYIDDMKTQGAYSDCCCAEIIMGDICSDCREHCEAIEDEEYD